MLFIDKQRTHSPRRSNRLPLSLPRQALQEPLEIVHGNDMVRLMELVQPVRQLCNMMCDYVTSRSEVASKIPCEKGCSECCDYLVPVSVLEAVKLVEEVERFPKKIKNDMKDNSLRISRKILENKPPQDLPDDLTDGDSDVQSRSEMLSRWYKTLDVTCPFLYENYCLVYEFRPLSCRQYFVTGPACNCKSDKTKVLQPPVNLTHFLGLIISEFEADIPQAILLPFVFLWYQDNRHIFEKTYPEREIARVFAEKLAQFTEFAPLTC